MVNNNADALVEYHDNGPTGIKRFTTIVTLLFFAWFSIEPWNYAQANIGSQTNKDVVDYLSEDDEEQQQEPELSDANNPMLLDQTLFDLGRKLQTIQESQDPFHALLLLKAGLQEIESHIIQAHQQLLADFSEVEARIISNNLPDIILERQQHTVGEYTRSIDEVLSKLKIIHALSEQNNLNGSGQTPQALLDQVESLSEYIQAHITKPLHNPINPQQLPRRAAKLQQRLPAAIDSAFSFSANSQKSNSHHVDFDETATILVSPKIKQLAATLQHDPVAIYNWLLQNITFKPTYGILQGSEGCLITQVCNAFDASALLIALLRASDIPARLRIGTIELPQSLFMSAVGDFQNLESAVKLAQSGGVPVEVVKDTENKPEKIRMDHAWVEVKLADAHGEYSNPWLALEPVLKPMKFQAPQAMGEYMQTVAGAALEDLLTASLNPQETKQLSFERTAKRLSATDDLQGRLLSDAPNLSSLPAELPETIIASSPPLEDFPDTLIQRVAISLGDITQTPKVLLEAPVASLAHRNVSLSYRGFQESDQLTIDAFGGLYQTPPYLLQLVPQITIDGEIIASGDPVMMGQAQRLVVKFFNTDNTTDQLQHLLHAGSIGALGLNPQASVNVNPQSMAKENNDSLSLDPESSAIETILQKIRRRYFSQAELARRKLSSEYQVIGLYHTEESMTAYQPRFVYALSASPLLVYQSTITMDVQRAIISAVSRFEKRMDERLWLLNEGKKTSFLESETILLAIGFLSISPFPHYVNQSTDPIEIINSEGLEFSKNINVADQIKIDISAALASGYEVHISNTDNNTNYAISNNESGVISYMMNAGLGGAEVVLEWVKIIAGWLDFLTLGLIPSEDVYRCFDTNDFFKSFVVIVIPALLATLIIGGPILVFLAFFGNSIGWLGVAFSILAWLVLGRLPALFCK